MPDPARRIVVGVDGSPSSERALDWAIGEAQRRGAALHLVAAWMFPMVLGFTFTSTVGEVRDAAQEVIGAGIAHVRDVAPEVQVTGETVEQMPAPALVAAAVRAGGPTAGANAKTGTRPAKTAAGGRIVSMRPLRTVPVTALCSQSSKDQVKTCTRYRVIGGPGEGNCRRCKLWQAGPER